jgi:hypothetical protein
VREKRKHPRKQLHPPVRIELPAGASAAARCRDISLGGAYLETEAVLPFGAEVTLAFELPDLDTEARIPAIVRWTKPGGMGVQFGAMGARETHGLVTLLAGPAARVA